MERTRYLSKYLLIGFVAMIFVNWYVGYPDSVDKYVEVDKPISYIKAKEKYRDSAHLGHNHWERIRYSYVRTRTLIPFFYHKDTISVPTIQLHSQKIDEE